VCESEIQKTTKYQHYSAAFTLQSAKRMDEKPYSEPPKVKARRLALGHAVHLLSNRRRAAAVVSVDYVRRVKSELMRSAVPGDLHFARKARATIIKMWEDLWSSSVGTRRARDLTIAYLAGPEPLNDFRELVRLGVHPNNIWTFENESKTFGDAIMSIKASQFPLLKIHGGGIEHFFATVPKVFDIVYIDACGPLPSKSQGTLRTVANLFRFSRLASPGVLITNFAGPPTEDSADKIAYADFISAYLFPKGCLESDRREWNLTDGALAHSFVPKETAPKAKSFFHEVLRHIEKYYEQFVTRQLFDLGSFVSPCSRLANASALWDYLFTISPWDAARKATNLQHMDGEGNGGDFITDPEMHPLGWTITALLNSDAEAADPNYPTINSDSRKLRDRWLLELDGFPTPKIKASEAILAYDVVRETPAGKTATFAALMRNHDYMNRMFQFCDVPTSELAFFPIIAQLSHPMHYNIRETRRYTYRARGKRTQMFLDVIPFDACRYIYDWLPTMELVADSFQFVASQLVYRFALDGLAKQRLRYNSEYLFGANVVGVNTKGFEEPLLEVRQRL
jgi:hypothetical protein